MFENLKLDTRLVVFGILLDYDWVKNLITGEWASGGTLYYVTSLDSIINGRHFLTL